MSRKHKGAGSIYIIEQTYLFSRFVSKIYRGHVITLFSILILKKIDFQTFHDLKIFFHPCFPLRYILNWHYY